MCDFKKYFSESCDEALRNILKKKITGSFFFVNTEIIGYSVLKRPLECFSIGNSPNKVLLCGGFHGMEWITCHLLYMFIINVCRSIINHKKLSDKNLWEYFGKRSLAVVPCVNPDGVEISIHGSRSAGMLSDFVERISGGDTLHWQSNAMGVDINHNFNADWQTVKKRELQNGIAFPSKTRYGGEFPESEPESHCLADFCRNNKIISATAFHSQGEEIYWSYGDSTPPKSLKIAEKMSELSGYSLSFPEEMAVGGGFKDWSIQQLHIPSFTVEVGKGENPLDISQLDGIYNKLENMLVYLISA